MGNLAQHQAVLQVGGHRYSAGKARGKQCPEHQTGPRQFELPPMIMVVAFERKVSLAKMTMLDM